MKCKEYKKRDNRSDHSYSKTEKTAKKKVVVNTKNNIK